MANMSYCRFRNTLSDLRDCYEHMYEVFSAEEASARKGLIALCQKIVDEYGDEDETDPG